MTLESTNLNPEDVLRVLRGMQVRMRNIALRHLSSIGPRTLRALQDLNLFQAEAPAIGDDLDLSVLRDPDHPKRQNITAGPILLYLIDGDEPKQIAAELPIFFLSESQDIRKAVLECLDNMVSRDPSLLTPKTLALLNEHKEALLSESHEQWRPASIAVYDSFYDDILNALNATRQCLTSMPVLEDILNFYAPRLLHPTVTSLDSISLSVSNIERDHKCLEILLSDIISRASNLSELCRVYLLELGFLPLAAPYGLAAVVNRWLDSNPGTNTWQEVWAWARTESSPLSRYHACSVFVLFPRLIPDGKLPELWREIIKIVKDQEQKESDDPISETWRLRRDLARHYAYHLEARLPDNDGGSIGCFAWWFAEKVAGIFPANASAAKFYREGWAKPALEVSARVWLTANAPVQYSFLRYITLIHDSPWAIALMTLMGEELDNLAPTEQHEEIRAEFNEAIVKNAIFSLPFPLTSPEDPTFAQECSFSNIVLKWAQYQTDEVRQGLQELISTSQILGSNDGLCKALRELSKSSLADQLAVCIAFKTKVAIDPTIADDVWEVISDVRWRKEVLGKMEQKALAALIESLSMLLIDNKGKWFSYLPHYIAELCEEEEDEERRRNLFLYVIHTSLAADNISAVCRLTRGGKRAKYIEYVKEYREYVESSLSGYPPWVAGKVRGLLASLHIH